MKVQLEKQLEQIDKDLDMSFKDFVNQVLDYAEVMSYDPDCEKTVEENQIDMIKNIGEEFLLRRKTLIQDAIDLQKELDDILGLRGEA